MNNIFHRSLLGLGLALLGVSAHATDFLNVSYDPTREFYQAYNQDFANFWKKRTG